MPKTTPPIDDAALETQAKAAPEASYVLRPGFKLGGAPLGGGPSVELPQDAEITAGELMADYGINGPMLDLYVRRGDLIQLAGRCPHCGKSPREA